LASFPHKQEGTSQAFDMQTGQPGDMAWVTPQKHWTALSSGGDVGFNGDLASPRPSLCPEDAWRLMTHYDPIWPGSVTGTVGLHHMTGCLTVNGHAERVMYPGPGV
jgi:hypothetical protein